MNYIGTKDEVCQQLKIFLAPAPLPFPVVYATDRSKAVVSVLILCSFVVYTMGRLMFYVFSCCLSSLLRLF